jgi:hypothetical protein
MARRRCGIIGRDNREVGSERERVDGIVLFLFNIKIHVIILIGQCHSCFSTTLYKPFLSPHPPTLYTQNSYPIHAPRISSPHFTATFTISILQRIRHAILLSTKITTYESLADFSCAFSTIMYSPTIGMTYHALPTYHTLARLPPSHHHDLLFPAFAYLPPLRSYTTPSTPVSAPSKPPELPFLQSIAQKAFSPSSAPLSSP